MENAKNSEDTNNELTVNPHVPKRGTRICTHTDVLRRNLWLAWNILKKAIKGSETTIVRIDSPKTEKDEPTK